jgi:hypothetical protein
MRIIIAYNSDGHMILNIYMEHYMGYNNIAVAEPIELKFKTLDNEGMDPHPPTLKLPLHMAEDFLAALKEAIEPHDKKKEKEIKLQVENKMLREQIEHLKELLIPGKEKGRRIEL